MADLRAVIFDYYETLADLSVGVRERLFDDLARRLGQPLPPGAGFRQWRELTTKDWQLRLGRQRPAVDGPLPPFRTFQEVWLLRMKELFQHWGVDAGADVGVDAYREMHAGAVLYPEVSETIETLGKRYRIAVLSDADRDFLDASMRRNGLAFETVVDSEEVRAYKPHVSMFRAACDRLGIAPAEAAYVGDSPWADIEGARHAGLRPVWVNRHDASWPEEVAPPPDQISTLAELSELFEKPA